MLKKIRLCIFNFFKCIWYLIVIYVAFNVLEQLKLLDFFNIDILPIVTKEIFLWLFGIVDVILIYLACGDAIRIAHFIKKNTIAIEVAFYIAGIIIFKKYFLDANLLKIVISELILLIYLIRYFITYIYTYDTKEKECEITNFTERPVIGEDKLTKEQNKAFEELYKIVKSRTKDESINIALIGEWGKGKTSITESLARTLQESSEYFVLKINTQTFYATSNIIEYVKEYFLCLFEKYEIRLLGAQESVSFLTSLGEMFKGVGNVSSWIEKIRGDYGGYFIDIESERELFSENVSELLSASNKKNIVLIVDDADRSEIKSDVLHLLSEFSSIRGILSIICLDKDSDLNLQSRGIDKNVVYDAIDKYIHIRVRIGDSDHIEYESNITNQILAEYAKISKKENRYIIFNGRFDRVKIFEKVKDIQTSINSKRNYLTNSDSDIMTDIFFENLKCNNMSFGIYLESIIRGYIYSTEELGVHINKIKQEGIYLKDSMLWGIKFLWTDMLEDESLDWMIQLLNNSYKIFSTLCSILDGLILLKEEKELVRDVHNMIDVFEYYNWKKSILLLPGYTWGNWTNYNMDFGIKEPLFIVFNKEEQTMINKLIKRFDYKKAYGEIEKKLEGTADFYIQITLLSDFIQYLRKVINNYRMFKMQLREAEIQDMNYLDYLLKQWKPNKMCFETIENVKKQYDCLNDFQFTWPSLKSYITMILFHNYMTKYKEKLLELEKWKNCKVSLSYGENQPIIIISGEENKEIKNILLNFLDLDKDPYYIYE